jgi:mono/diheme cytochrome c family protein
MSIGRKHIFGGAAILLAGGVAVASWWAMTRTDPKLLPDDPAVVTRGAAIYVSQCASCHGARLEGQPDWRSRRPDGKLPAPPHDETGHTWHHPDATLFDLTKRGPAAMIGGDYESDMPGFAETLSDDAIIAVLSYIKSAWPARVRQRHDKMNERSN